MHQQDVSGTEFAMLWLIAIGALSLSPTNWLRALQVWLGLWTVLFAVVIGLCMWVIAWGVVREKAKRWVGRWIKIEEVKH